MYLLIPNNPFRVSKTTATKCYVSPWDLKIDAKAWQDKNAEINHSIENLYKRIKRFKLDLF